MKIKEYILTGLVLLGSLPDNFFKSDFSMSLGIFIDRQADLGHFVLYYVNTITFIALMYLLHKSKYLNQNLTRIILLITILDLIFLVLWSGQIQDSGIIKLGSATLINYVYGIYKKYI